MADVRRILGIDPGPKSHGWCLVELGPRDSVTYCDGGLTTEGVVDFLRGFEGGLFSRSTVSLVAIETPEGYAYEQARGADLLATGVIAGMFAGAAQALGFAGATCSAAEWRHGLIGTASAPDAMIATVLRLKVPSLPKKCSVHVRDAIGTALYCGLREGIAARSRPAVRKAVKS